MITKLLNDQAKTSKRPSLIDWYTFSREWPEDALGQNILSEKGFCLFICEKVGEFGDPQHPKTLEL